MKKIKKICAGKKKFLLIQFPLFEQLPYISEDEGTSINYGILTECFAYQ